MATSVCILGYGNLAQALVKKLKSFENYGNNFRVHCVQVQNSESEKYSNLSTVIKYSESNWLRVLLDGTENTENQTPLGNDTEWLLSSDGHNIVVDCMSYNEKSVKLIMNLVKKGKKFRYIISSKKLAEGHGGDLQMLAMAHGGVFNFKPAYEIGIDNVVNEIYLDIISEYNIEMKRAKEEKEESLRMSGQPCGLEDTFSWEELK